MEKKTFLEHYRLCREEGAPVELDRGSSRVSYKALDTRFSETVVLTRVPLAEVDPAEKATFEEQARAARVLDHVNIVKLLGFGQEKGEFILVTEYLEGETLDAWVAAHGPMPPEAVLRVALQAVNAVAAAGYHGVTHRALHPGNFVIIPDQVAEGGWPFVKIANFGMSGSTAYSSQAAQFRSPEQRENGTLDFRSEIYALGATMCFLLTGESDPGTRLPLLKHFSKPLRNLLGHMLKENPEERPQDPVVLAEAIRDCLTKVMRRQEFARKFTLPVIPAFAKKSVRAPVWMPPRALAIATLILMLAVLSGVLWPQNLAALFHRRSAGEPIGVPIGVPDPISATNMPQPAVAPSAPALAATNQNVPVNPPAPQPVETTGPDQSNANEIVAKNTKAQAEPLPPAEGPKEPATDNADDQRVASAAPENSRAEAPGNDVATESPVETDDRATPSETPKSAAPAKAKATVKHRPSNTSRRARVAQLRDPSDDEPPMAAGTYRARVVGTTPDGRVILSLPSGGTAVVEPPRRRVRRLRVERSERFLPPLQPFDPGYPVGD